MCVCICVFLCVQRRRRCVCILGGRRKTGNAAHRIDSHALPRRSEYWSRRPPAHVVRYVATPHDKESVFGKKYTHTHLYIYKPNKHHHLYLRYCASRGWFHIKEEPLKWVDCTRTRSRSCLFLFCSSSCVPMKWSTWTTRTRWISVVIFFAFWPSGDW